MAPNFGFNLMGGHTGSAPSPFDALNGPRLAGSEGSHPLHSVAAEELLRPTDGAVTGEILVDHPARVGEGITGKIRIQAVKEVSARNAYLRLTGLRLDEVRRSEDHRDSDGSISYTEHWVETSGRLFVTDAFIDPRVPASLQPGQTWEAPFAIPAPQLGPPTSHLGESIIAWALEVRWDIPMGSDHWVALYLPLAQHPDLIRAGVGKQGGMSLLASVASGDATINVATPLPAPAGQEMQVRIYWPSAPQGQNARRGHRTTGRDRLVRGRPSSGRAPSRRGAGAAEYAGCIPSAGDIALWLSGKLSSRPAVAAQRAASSRTRGTTAAGLAIRRQSGTTRSAGAVAEASEAGTAGAVSEMSGRSGSPRPSSQ